ncbi:MAG: hypothetical protein J6P37_01725 [Lachnospiraceae bacterium]|nr:hypothetical protein [Lachnospiraceae bacterium]
MKKRKLRLLNIIYLLFLLTGTFSRASFSDVDFQIKNNILHNEATISSINNSLQEDALITNGSSIGYLGEVVCFSVKRVTSVSKGILSVLLAWIIPILCLYLLLLQSYAFTGIQKQRKPKYSVIDYIHDSDGRKRSSDFSLCIC